MDEKTPFLDNHNPHSDTEKGISRENHKYTIAQAKDPKDEEIERLTSELQSLKYEQKKREEREEISKDAQKVKSGFMMVELGLGLFKFITWILS